MEKIHRKSTQTDERIWSAQTNAKLSDVNRRNHETDDLFLFPILLLIFVSSANSIDDTVTKHEYAQQLSLLSGSLPVWIDEIFIKVWFEVNIDNKRHAVYVTVSFIIPMKKTVTYSTRTWICVSRRQRHKSYPRWTEIRNNLFVHSVVFDALYKYLT